MERADNVFLSLGGLLVMNSVTIGVIKNNIIRMITNK